MSKKSRPKKQITSERLQELGFAYAPPLIISAAVSNKVFDALENGAKTVEQVSKETGASARGLRAIMDALVGLELLKKGPESRYSLTSEPRRTNGVFLGIARLRFRARQNLDHYGRQSQHKRVSCSGDIPSGSKH